ncbi:MAG: putative hydrolase of the superfamily [Halanaerobiales bacterium]|nr:putative hydrolase of the superfamily [Halanaerobiales bacterium]
MIKALIFDLDDTLYYELEYVKSGFRAVSNYISARYDLSAKDFYNKLLTVLDEEGRGKTFDLTLAHFGLPGAEVERMVNIYRKHKPDNLRLYPDVERVFAGLKGNYKLGLITDGNFTVQWNKIKELGLNKLIEEIIVTDDYGVDRRKPSSFAYLKLLERFNVNPEEAVYIGDNPEKDFITARRLGMKTIRIIREKGMYIDKRLSPEYEADYEINFFSELEKALKSF